MKRAIAVLLVLVAMVPLAFAMGGGESDNVSENGYKNVITVALNADVTSFDPHVGKETPAVAVTNHIFDTLVDIDPETDEVVPQIAESWEIISDTEYRFHIRQGIKFHNGEALTAEDVKYSLDRAIASPAVSYIVDFIDEVIVEDEYTVLVKLDAPYAPALRNLAVPFAAIVPMDYTSANEDILRTAPVGSGPYKFEEWSQNDRTVLVANEDYYAGAPLTEEIVFKVIPEAAQRTIALETGEVDIAYDPLTADKQRIAENDDLMIYSSPSVNCYYLTLNMAKAPFDNKLVRQAISHAIDRQLIVDTLYMGSGQPADDIIAPSVFGYFGCGVDEYDPELAKQLLAEAGYPDGFSCSIWVNNSQERVEVCQVIQAMLGEIGIDCSLEVMEFGAFLSRTSAGEHDMAFFGWVTSTMDADYTYYSLEHSSQQGAAGNRSFTSDPEVDRLVETGRFSTDEAVRLQAYKDLSVYLKDLANNINIIYTEISAGAGKNVENFKLDPLGYHELQNVQVRGRR